MPHWDDSDPYTACLFADDERSVWAGACWFRTDQFTNLDLSVESLHWIRLHPYCRGRGVLKKHWSTFRANHGDFYVEQPFSWAMREFLLKHNQDSVWYPIFEGKRPDLADIKAKLAACG